LALALAVPTWAYASIGKSVNKASPSGDSYVPGNQNHNQRLPPAGFVNTGTSYDLTIGDAKPAWGC